MVLQTEDSSVLTAQSIGFLQSGLTYRTSARERHVGREESSVLKFCRNVDSLSSLAVGSWVLQQEIFDDSKRVAGIARKERCEQ
jgi:hypothetical protein